MGEKKKWGKVLRKKAEQKKGTKIEKWGVAGRGRMRQELAALAQGCGVRPPSCRMGCEAPKTRENFKRAAGLVLDLYMSFLCLAQSALGILFPASPAAPFGKHRPANCRQLQAERKILSLNQRGHLFGASFSRDSGGNKGTLSSPFRPQILIL